MAGTVLDDIIAGVRADLAAREQQRSLDDVTAAAQVAEPALDAMAAFRAAPFALIAEVKRRSPSRGDLAAIADPASLARSYAAGGATAISVLTEQRRFAGSLDDLVAVRAAVDIPVLRKDFIVTAYQVFEARAAGADLVLLIVAGLEQAELVSLRLLIEELGMTALIEVHDATELQRAFDAGATLVGVNARDLKTLSVDTSRFADLAPLIPSSVIAIAESGVTTAGQAVNYAAAGADGVLVGEGLVTTGDPTAAAAQLIAAGVSARTPRTELSRA